MNKRRIRKIRLFYMVAAILLFLTELIIALYVRDSFIRPYVGDVLVVMFIYAFVRIWIPVKIVTLPLWIFLFSAGIEFLQCFHIVTLLGLQDNKVMSVLIGSVFDLKDVACYAAGCAILGIYEIVIYRKRYQDCGE